MENSDRPSVQQLVRALRKAGVTWEEIAKATCASERTVHRWAEGKPALPVFEGGIRKLAEERGLLEAA